MSVKASRAIPLSKTQQHNTTSDDDSKVAVNAFDFSSQDWPTLYDEKERLPAPGYRGLAKDFSRFRKRVRQGWKLQSSEEILHSTDHAASSTSHAQNITFVDDLKAQDISMGTLDAGGYDQDNDEVAHLSDYLSRPVRIIQNSAWTIGTPFSFANVNPWQLYFNDAYVKNKLQNFGKIRCKLHLKFMVNGSPFHYGSIRACYFPLVDSRSTYTSLADLVPFSQTPGVYLEPQNMTTSEMELPFLWPHNWLEITKNSDFVSMGVLTLTEYATLASANGATGSISLSCYAWATDVEVMGPTSLGALQGDEYVTSQGTISGPATAVASVAARLADAPVIGPFARATEVGARATASIARLFGYSNPPMIDDVHAYQPKSFHAFANAETRMPLDKLSLDPKNEVTISSKVAGVDEPDPLVFKELLCRESYLDKVTWDSSKTQLTLLWSALVNPHYSYLAGGYHTTPPMTHFSSNFRLWRGSIVYKFRFIKTQFHRGRVIISYDPNGDITANNDTETTTFTRIVDLNTEDEVEFSVPYKSTAPMSQVPSLASWPATYSSSTTPTYSFDPAYHNGCITVRVQNVLSGPTTSPSITMLCYVRAGEDFMLAAPTTLSSSLTLRDPAMVIQSSEKVVSIAQATSSADTNVASITTGEVIASMRPLLHRTHYILSQALGGGTTTNTTGLITTNNVYTRVPQGWGRAWQGNNAYNYATVSAASVGYVFGTNNPIDWTLDCFVGYRGSMNVHVNVNQAPGSVTNIGTLAITRNYGIPVISATRNLNGSTAVVTYAASNPYATYARSGTTGNFNSGAGATITNPATQTAISANIPQYWPTRFMPAFHTVRSVDPKNPLFYDNFSVVARGITAVSDATPPTSWPILDLWQSAGVDFQPIFYLCTPRIFAASVPPGSDT